MRLQASRNRICRGTWGADVFLTLSLLFLFAFSDGTAPASADDRPIVTPETVMLESTNFPGMFMRHQNWQGFLSKLSSDLDNQDATFVMSAALSGHGRTSVSLQARYHGRMYLRNKDSVLVLEKDDGTDPNFRQDASFIPYQVPGGTIFESASAPGKYIRHKNFKLLVEEGDGTTQFDRDSTFKVDVVESDAPPVPKNSTTPPITVNNGDGGGGRQAIAAGGTTIYFKPNGDESDANIAGFVDAGETVTVLRCRNHFCQISKPKPGWVWGADINRG